MKKLVLIRHGESTWNRENRFTGWLDVGLTERGVQEAVQAGRVLAEKGFTFDVAYTSVLKRVVWRRSYDVPPPPLSKDDERYPAKDPRYASLKPEEIPLTESLKDVVARFLPHWHEVIAPAIRQGQRVLIVAHGNSLRGLVKFLDNISDENIVELNIPTGIPLVYELNDDLTPIRSYYLGDPQKIGRAINDVAGQLRLKEK